MTELKHMDPYEVSCGEGGLSRLLPPIIELQKSSGAKAATFTRDDVTFAEWVAIIDTLLVRKYGVGFFDLPDWCYRDAYDEGCTAGEGRDRAIDESDMGDAIREAFD
jgi:hypothetical protein